MDRSTDSQALAAPVSLKPALPMGRIEAVDFARGVAVGLMILSHGVNGLLSFGDFPSWGLVPVHAVTTLLERLEAGELLDDAHTALLLEHMQAITTGDDRIAAGLPDGVAFAQKTGTQIARACNVGIIHPRSEKPTLIVVACAEDFEELSQAERAFQQLGRAIGAAFALE